MKGLGLYKRGVHNANKIDIKEVTHNFSHLPKKFHGFKVLHLSDLHFDPKLQTVENILKYLHQIEVDLCVMTGDYGAPFWIGSYSLEQNHIIQCMRELVKGIKAKHGLLGILGNHDSCNLVQPLEELGIKMLINEKHLINIDGDILQFIGTDDVHYFYTHNINDILKEAKDQFSIGLVHSPELFDIAQTMGIDLYLCGHTHGGQICLPFGIPILTHLKRGRRFYKGCWKFKNMRGYTSTGIGTTAAPVRFNTRPEIIVHKLCQEEGL